MKVIILAAGYATRLYPLTKDKPKALLPIGSKPLINHLMDKIEAIDACTGVVLVTNSRFYGMFHQWAKDLETSKTIQVIDDKTTSNDNRLGAIGDLQFAIEGASVNEDILVLASDNLFEESLNDFVTEAMKKSEDAAIGIYDIGDPKVAAGRYGIIEVDEDFRILNIEEKPQEPKTTLVSMGVYFFSHKSLPLMAEYLASSDKQDAPGHYATWLLKKVVVFGHLFKGKWYDIGSLDQLNEASANYK